MSQGNLSSAEALQYIQNLEVDRAASFRASPDEARSQRVFERGAGTANQAVVIGSQITEFATEMGPEQCEQIANSLLLAQLAANKKAGSVEVSAKKWFECYVEILTSIGWFGKGAVESGHEVSGDSVRASKEIVAVVAAALGPAAAAASIVLAALRGLENMDKNSPWITLFERETQTRNVQQFQISYVDAGECGLPEIVIACFELNASATVTQILFFRSKSSSAKLTHRQAVLSTNSQVFEDVKDSVNEKIAGHVRGMISRMEI